METITKDEAARGGGYGEGIPRFVAVAFRRRGGLVGSRMRKPRVCRMSGSNGEATCGV